MRRALRFALAVTPPLMLTLAIPLVNRTEPRIAGLPFLLAWIVAWILLAPCCYWAIYKMEGRR